jgi:phytoene desaturase
MSAPRAIVIGAGVGGLAAARALAQHGVSVCVCEASPFAGGLASAFDADSVRFDGGPYILLDRPGLAWAFAQLDIPMAESLELAPVHHVYSVMRPGSAPVDIYARLDETAEALDHAYPGSAHKYRRFVEEMTRAHTQLAPLLTHEDPGARAAFETGAALALPTLLRSLRAVLRRSGLPDTVCEALGIWTHIAGQSLHHAPSPLAFVTALIHREGCFVPRRGVGAIPDVLRDHAVMSGVTLRLSTPVRSIRIEGGRVRGVELESGEVLDADIVVSNAGGPKTLLQLARGTSDLEGYAAALPLQSPGVAAYVLLERPPQGAYLRFWLDTGDTRAPSRLIVRPSTVAHTEAALARAPNIPARLVAPLAQESAVTLGPEGQAELLERILEEPSLRDDLGPARVVVKRTPRDYGARHHLFGDAMNPVMTAAFMRKGRMPHRLVSPRGLYLVGSSTHPGQWVSFCAISGVLGARKALRDLHIEPVTHT